MRVCMAVSLRWLAAILLALALSACGGDDRKLIDAPAADLAAEGRAVKGVLQGAKVSAYTFDEEGQPTRFLATTLTDSQG